MIDTLYLFIILLLIGIFIISFTLFIKRIVINSSNKVDRMTDLQKSMERIIEQNEQLLAVLKEKNK